MTRRRRDSSRLKASIRQRKKKNQNPATRVNTSQGSSSTQPSITIRSINGTIFPSHSSNPHNHRPKKKNGIRNGKMEKKKHAGIC